MNVILNHEKFIVKLEYETSSVGVYFLDFITYFKVLSFLYMT